MSYPVDGKPDDRHAILGPQGAGGWLTLSALLLAAACLLGLLSRWFGGAPGIYAVVFGVFGLITLVGALVRWLSRKTAKLWLDGDMLEYRAVGVGTVLFNLLTFGGAYVSVEGGAGVGRTRIYLDFRIDTEEEHFIETGFNPPHRPFGYLNRVPMAGVVGMDSMQAQYFADEINRRRGLSYKWPAQSPRAT